MKKILLSGILASIVMLIIEMAMMPISNSLFPSLAAEYQNPGIFRAWTDPLMSLYFLCPFLNGFLFAWVWNKTKSLINDTTWKRGLKFGLILWILLTIPGMLISYASFQLSLTMIFAWTISALIELLIAGLIYARVNK